MLDERNPTISIIVPARNEEDCIARCLESLVSQTGIEFEIIVVDDGSTDRTAEIARSFTAPTGPSANPRLSGQPAAGSGLVRVSVISAPPLPDNWTGKNNAMSSGAKMSRGRWLLFTDADTFHKPGSLARAVAEAEQEGAALLSYSPEQEVRTILEKAVMPVIFAELAATYPPSKVRDPNSSLAAANGQYLMISREAYDAVGGHTKIASDLLEDVAMARLVKSSGRKVWFRYGGDAVRTRMYRSWPQMREGWTKNLARLFPQPMLRGLMLLLFWAVAWSTFALAFTGMATGHPSALAYVVPTAFLYFRIAFGRFRSSATFLALVFGVLIAAYLLFASASAHSKGAVVWKGRKYGADVPPGA